MVGDLQDSIDNRNGANSSKAATWLINACAGYGHLRGEKSHYRVERVPQSIGGMPEGGINTHSK